MTTAELYSPKQMTQALLESLPARQFLTSTFFGEEVHDTKSFQIDIWRGSRRLAPIVSRVQGGKVVDREKFSTKEFTPPYLKPKKITEADHILTRQPGEIVYTQPGANTPAARAAALLGRDLAELDESIVRRIEAMAAEALASGQVTCVGDGYNQVVSFDFAATHTPTLTGTDLWTNSASNPIAKLREWKRLIAKDSGISATDVILGQSAADAFLANVEVKAAMNQWNAMYGNLNPVDQGQGVTLLGKVADLNIWTYDEWYINDAGSEVPMIPVNKAIVLSRNLRAIVHYGVISDIEAGNYASRVFAKSWVESDPSCRQLLLQSAPLPVVHQTNAIVTAVVI